jgi:hypothetical protein
LSGRDRGETVEQRGDGLVLRAKPNRIDDEARGAVVDLFDDDEVVLAQRAARRDEIDDQVREPDERRELNGAVQRDQLDWQIALREERLRRARELRRDA